jgi:MraZ protein
MFAGENFCKLDEKGRFLLPPYIRDLLCPEGQAGERGVVFLKRSEPTCLRTYTLTEWTGVLTKTRARLDEDQSRLFMHHVVSETATSEIDKAGRILIPPMLREHADLDKEVLWAGMGRTAELWSRARWKKAQEMSETELTHFKAALSEQFRL